LLLRLSRRRPKNCRDEPHAYRTLGEGVSADNRTRSRGRDGSGRTWRAGENHHRGYPGFESREMLGPSGAARVMAATKPVDFRKGAEGLAGLARETMQADPFSGAIYVFRAKRADRIKLIFWDGAGVCLFAKRLEDGEFRWPKIEDGAMRLSAAEFSARLEGLDWRRVHTGKQTPAPTLPG
jgi:transposase